MIAKKRKCILKIIMVCFSLALLNSGFVFYDKDGNMLLAVQIYPTMEGYDELVKLFPKIPYHVNNL